MVNYIPDDDYLSLLQSLNKEQRTFFDHMLHEAKTSDKESFTFLTGGAGVGIELVICW